MKKTSGPYDVVRSCSFCDGKSDVSACLKWCIFEVGGTTTNIGVIKDGRPAIDYSNVGGHRTYISSLDVRVLGVAGGSMVRADKSGVKDVGPRSAHIAGMDYAVFTPEEEIVDPKSYSSARKREILRTM